jgi:hypothetical protein
MLLPERSKIVISPGAAMCSAEFYRGISNQQSRGSSRDGLAFGDRGTSRVVFSDQNAQERSRGARSGVEIDCPRVRKIGLAGDDHAVNFAAAGNRHVVNNSRLAGAQNLEDGQQRDVELAGKELARQICGHVGLEKARAETPNERLCVEIWDWANSQAGQRGIERIHAAARCGAPGILSEIRW